VRGPARFFTPGRKRWAGEGTDWAGTLVASRYEAIARLCADLTQRSAGDRRPQCQRPHRRRRHASRPGAGSCSAPSWPLLFLSIFTFAEHPMNWIDGHIAALGDWVKGAMAPGDLRDLITDGAIAGVSGVVIFLPQILILFFFIGLLESTGYMARAAFIMDRLMSRVGLNGKSRSFPCSAPTPARFPASWPPAPSRTRRTGSSPSSSRR
jgi:ferrous iron transport protein B